MHAVCLHVCMYACIYVSMHAVCMFICMFVCMFICMFVCMYVCLVGCMRYNFCFFDCLEQASTDDSGAHHHYVENVKRGDSQKLCRFQFICSKTHGEVSEVLGWRLKRVVSVHIAQYLPATSVSKLAPRSRSKQ